MLCKPLIVVGVFTNVNQSTLEASSNIVSDTVWSLHHEAFPHHLQGMAVIESILPHLNLENTSVPQYLNDIIEELLIFQQIKHRIETELHFVRV